MPGPTHSTARPGISRRTLLQGAALTASAVAGTSFGGATAWAAPAPNRGPVRQPFTLGVASGDPLPDGVVLWTRLAPDPLAADGRSGMPDRVVPVQWQVATDERFRDVVARGTELARPELGHSVHPEVRGLRPGAEYFYRFKAGPELSPVGRTKTALDRPGPRHSARPLLVRLHLLPGLDRGAVHRARPHGRGGARPGGAAR